MTVVIAGAASGFIMALVFATAGVMMPEEGKNYK
jgi:hypothetical protein